MKKGYLPYLALVVTSLVWGTTWVASKIGIQTGIHPLYFSAIRQTLGGLCFLIFFLAIGKAPWPNLREWGYLFLMAFLLFVASNGLTTWGIKYINSGLGSIIGAIAPLFVAMVEWMRGSKDKPNMLASIGLMLGFAGVGIIFLEHLHDFANPEFAFGIGLSLIAAFTWALGTVVTTHTKLSINRYYSLGWQMFIAGFLLNLISMAGGVAIPVQEISATAWITLVYMVAFGSIITFGAFIYSLQHLPPSLASIYAYINPMVAVVLGHYILGEAWSLQLLVGALVTLAGVWLVNTGFKVAKSGKDLKDLTWHQWLLGRRM